MDRHNFPAGPRVEWQKNLMEPLEKMLKATITYDEKQQRFFVLKYLHLIAEETGTPIRFFSLYREKSTDNFVKVETAESLYQLDHNPVLEEFERLYQHELSRFYGTRPA